MKNLFLLSIILVMSACTTRITDFTILSTKNVDLADMGKYKRLPDRVTGSDTAHIILIIPTGTPNVKEAIDNAIESVPGGVALVDGVVTYSWFYIPYIFGEMTYTVEGNVLVDKERSAK